MSKHYRRKVLRCLLLTGALFAIYSSSASAAEISNVRVEDFKLNTARVYATVTGATSFKVEYGGTKYLEYQSQTVSVTGSGEVPVSIELVGLHPQSTYHYRVSVNSGAVKSPEAEFEMLKAWKVDGETVNDNFGPVGFNDEYKGAEGEGGYLELRGATSKGEERLYCRQSSAVTGVLGVAYEHLEFTKGCIAELNLVNTPACAPFGIKLNLNGYLAQKGALSVGLGEECPTGSAPSIQKLGFSPPEEGENPKLEGRFEGSAWVNGKEWAVNFRPRTAKQLGAWKLTKPFGLEPFGVS
jgi:hypothetical protein